MLPVLLLVLALDGYVSPVTIYVGPMNRDGFVDVSRDVQDSVRDLRDAIAKDKSLTLESEPRAAVKLYLTGRRKTPSQSITVGTVVKGSGTVASIPTEVFSCEATLRVGDYEQTFRSEKNQATDWRVTWKKCAKGIAKDISAWVAANRYRIQAER